MRHPIRATLSATLAMLALLWAGVPVEAGIGVGLAIGWIIAATTPDRHERILRHRQTEDFLIHHYDD